MLGIPVERYATESEAFQAAMRHAIGSNRRVLFMSRERSGVLNGRQLKQMLPSIYVTRSRNPDGS